VDLMRKRIVLRCQSALVKFNVDEFIQLAVTREKYVTQPRELPGDVVQDFAYGIAWHFHIENAAGIVPEVNGYVYFYARRLTSTHVDSSFLALLIQW
jgi:hypothetical protein